MSPVLVGVSSKAETEARKGLGKALNQGGTGLQNEGVATDKKGEELRQEHLQ